MSRAKVSAAKLYSILDREFRALRPAQCNMCRVPLPYWNEAPDDVSAHWRFGTPSSCPYGCHVILAELLTRLWSQYDLDMPVPSKRLA